MIKAIEFGTPLCFNPKGKGTKYWANCFNGTFSAGKPISIMINKGEVIRDNSCHYIWQYPESVIWIKKDGSYGMSRVVTYTQIPGYKDIVFALGGLGISNYAPDLEGFCEFERVNIFNKKKEAKDFSDVLDKTNHSVFGFKDGVFFASIMYGTPLEIKAQCEYQGFEHVIMGDGRSWASCNTDDFDLNLEKSQYSLVQMTQLKRVVLREKGDDMIKIVLDAGHGPNTPGKRTPKFDDGTFMHEHEFNNAVIKKLKGKLNKTNKFSVAVVSSDTEDIPLAERVAKEKSIKPQLFLSVHANALNDQWGNGKGIESFYNKGSFKGEEYCNIFQKNLIKDTGLYNRGAKSAPGPYYPHSLYVLKNTYAPAVLVECGFMDNKEEAKLLISDSYRELVAESLFKSICSIFSVEYTEKPVDAIDYKKLYEEAQAKLDAIQAIL